MNSLLTEAAPGIRKFSDARINIAIESALAEMKPDEKVAIVAHHVYTGGENVTKLSAVYRLGPTFTVMAGAFKDWTKGDLGAEAKVVWKPKC